MRIFYAAANTAHPTALPHSRLWEANLLLPLRDLGHECVIFDFDYNEYNNNLDPSDPKQRAFIQANRPRLGKSLLAQVQRAHAEKPIDLFFSYFYAAHVPPEVIREIGSMGITTMNWYCNASYQFHLVEEIAPSYHFCLVPEKFRLDDYRRIGAHPIYCQEAANPDIYHPYPLRQEYDITFVGQRYRDRAAYIRTLLDAGLDVRVWGPNWNDPALHTPIKRIRNMLKRLLRRRSDLISTDRIGPPLSDEELIKMYSRSKISLGFTRLAQKPTDKAPDKQVRLRDFEATMSGAFYLVEYFEEFDEFFTPGKEIAVFRTPEELVKQARYYLTHDSEREQIRQAGLERARSNHTWQHRFRAVFREAGLE